MPVLRAVATAVRGRLAQVFAARFRVDGFIPLGCDGSRLACPRSAELERRLGLGKKPKRKKRPKKSGQGPCAGPPSQAAPVPRRPRPVRPAPRNCGSRRCCTWAWACCGRGGWAPATPTSGSTCGCLVDTLPRGALLVADAGYVGYDLMAGLQAAGLAFLLRLSSRAPLYVPDRSTLKKYREGVVYYWPQKVQKQDLPPLPVRLWRLRGDKGDVWLITNVLDEKRLPRHTAGKFYRWRWRNEGLFRTYKRTLGKVKLMSRTVAQVHREAEGLAAGDAVAVGPGRPGAAGHGHAARSCCPAPARCLLEIRAEMRNVTGMYLGPRQAADLRRATGAGPLAERRQRSRKVRRRWPGRQDHKPPGPPRDPQDGNHP